MTKAEFSKIITNCLEAENNSVIKDIAKYGGPWKVDRELVLGAQKIRVLLQGEEIYEFPGLTNITAVGFSPELRMRKLTLDQFEETASGNFIALKQSDEFVEIFCDAFAQSRCYFSLIDSIILITNDITALMKYGKLAFGAIDKNQVKYWTLTRTTFDSGTFFNNLYKIPPAARLIIDFNGLRVDYLFQRDPVLLSCEKYHSIDDLSELLSNEFEYIRHESEPVILMFSGGLDSSLLATVLKRKNIQFIPVYFHPLASDADQASLDRAHRSAGNLGISLEVIYVDLEDALASLKKNIYNFLFDRHFCLLHLGGLQILRSKYNNPIIINGQTSDSIFSFGPSTYTLQDILRRILVTRGIRWLLRPIFSLICSIFRISRARWPTTREDIAIAMATFERYILAVSCFGLDDGHFWDVVKAAAKSNMSTTELLLWIKRQTFMQGADNQVVYKAAHLAGIQRVVLPFASPSVYAWVAKNKSCVREIFVPKYPVRQSYLRLNKNKEHDVIYRKPNITDNCIKEEIQGINAVTLAEMAKRIRTLYVSEMKKYGVDIENIIEYELPL